MGSICLYMLIQKKVDKKLVNPTSVHCSKPFFKLEIWMLRNDDFFDKELNLNCFYINKNFGQKYPKPAIVKRRLSV